MPSDSPLKPLYEASTQFRNWRFSHARLNQIRSTLNDAAVSVIRTTFEAYEPGSSANVTFLTADEELLLVTFYATMITQICGRFRFPEEVEATAVSYLKRFYLKNTVMDWHPRNVMLTALFLATKTTNNPISLEAYTSHIPKTSASDVLDLEFLVAQSLRFEFAVWHAHRALWGIWLDIQSLPDTPPDFATTQSNIYDIALTHVRASRLTDAELIYTPSQIALAALHLAAPDIAKKWLQSKDDTLPRSGSEPPGILASVEGIQELIAKSGHVPDVEAVREVDRRLKLCKNPEKVVGSKAYLAKKAEEDKKAEDKRSRKANDTAVVDPFGDALERPKPGLVDYDDDDDDDDD
ncbi:cyclin-dependent protein kinase regulator [Moniliophthora roreri MCA 2997]|uniref:Cyclin-dependent protein kinase regulator n=1 Tax=Moniliophthora roreri (strain MCA 2997) TaxID=1381753 RepID=V2Y0Q0_MONRO|nr:cyclin-dependent protein kinase regulator [Moniliophthora roreri MCA 2997]